MKEEGRDQTTLLCKNEKNKPDLEYFWPCYFLLKE